MFVRKDQFANSRLLQINFQGVPIKADLMYRVAGLATQRSRTYKHGLARTSPEMIEWIKVLDQMPACLQARL